MKINFVMPKFKIGHDGYLYAVYKDNFVADDYYYFWHVILGRLIACFGQYDNAYRIVKVCVGSPEWKQWERERKAQKPM